MKIQIWQGYHESGLRSRIDQCWQQNDLLILCPPHLKDMSFTKHLPHGDIEFIGDWVNQQNEKRQVLPHYPEQPVLGVFTSGTISGKPRLILYSKKNIESSLAAIMSFFVESRISSIFCYPQPFHTFGLLLGYVLSLQKNIPLITATGKYTGKNTGKNTEKNNSEAHEVRLSLQDPGLLTLGTPTHFYDLIEYLKSSKKEIYPSYSCILGGAPVKVSLWEQAQDILKIAQPSIGYGCTEASPGVTHHPPGRKPVQDGEIGFPLSSLQSVAKSPTGVAIEGPALCLAVIENDEVTFPKKIIIRDSLSVREDGMWIYNGRLDLMFNRGGQKLSLELIEQTLFKETGIALVATAVEDDRLGETLALVIKCNESSDVLEEKIKLIKLALKNNFSLNIERKYLIPINEFPLNESFKLDRTWVKNICQEALKESIARTV